MALLLARSEAEAMQALKEHPELLSSDADTMLQQLISMPAGGHSGGRDSWPAARGLAGPEAVRHNGNLSSYSDLSQILQELSWPADLGDMPRRIKLCQRALELVPP